MYRLKKGDRGVSVIEFAILLPLLITLVIGIIEFGWILTGYITITGAAREGARVAVAGGDYEQAVDNHTASMPALSVTQTILTGDKGAKTTVTVTGSLNTFTKFFDFLGDGTYSFTSAATMRQEKFIIGSPPGGGEPEEPEHLPGCNYDHPNNPKPHKDCPVCFPNP